MPFTRVAVEALSPLFIGSGRAVVAALQGRFDDWWAAARPLMVNEGATGPKVNPFKERYWRQFGGGPDEALSKLMDPARSSIR